MLRWLATDAPHRIEAVDVLSEGLRRAPDQTEFLVMRGAILGRLQRYREAEQDLRRYAAIIESSEDAVISKNLDGVIMTKLDGTARGGVLATAEGIAATAVGNTASADADGAAATTKTKTKPKRPKRQRVRYPRGQLKERIGFLRRVRAMLGVVVIAGFAGAVADALTLFDSVVPGLIWCGYIGRLAHGISTDRESLFMRKNSVHLNRRNGILHVNAAWLFVRTAAMVNMVSQ